MLEKLQEMIRTTTGDKELSITEDTVLLSDTGLSSYDLVQLICEVEDEFDVEIPDKQIPKLKTVGDVMNYISEQ